MKKITLICISLLSINCFSQEFRKINQSKNLIFQSGFEGTCKVIPEKNYLELGSHPDKMVGADNSLKGGKNDWTQDLNNSPIGKVNFSFQYTGGDSTQRYAKIIDDPTKPKNKVLAFWLNDSWSADGGQYKARVQANLYEIEKPLKEFYQTIRVYFHPDFNALRNYPHKIPWCTISEFWNKEPWRSNDTEKYGFRITLGVGKPVDAEADLTFLLGAENAICGGHNGYKEVWKPESKHKVKVPIGKWFTMEYYYKDGDSKSGRFYMAIQPDGEPKQVVFDINNFTHHTLDPSPNGLGNYNPMKLYTSKELVAYMKGQGKTLQIYWDDFKLWGISK
jgi:hypothetical protein